MREDKDLHSDKDVLQRVPRCSSLFSRDHHSEQKRAETDKLTACKYVK